MHISIFIQFLQLFISFLPLKSIANAKDQDYEQSSYYWSKNCSCNISWFCSIVIVAIGIFIDSVRIPLWTISIKIAASACAVLIITLRIVSHSIILINDTWAISRTDHFFLPSFFFFFFFFPNMSFSNTYHSFLYYGAFS